MGTSLWILSGALTLLACAGRQLVEDSSGGVAAPQVLAFAGNLPTVALDIASQPPSTFCVLTEDRSAQCWGADLGTEDPLPGRYIDLAISDDGLAACGKLEEGGWSCTGPERDREFGPEVEQVKLFTIDDWCTLSKGQIECDRDTGYPDGELSEWLQSFDEVQAWEQTGRGACVLSQDAWACTPRDYDSFTAGLGPEAEVVLGAEIFMFVGKDDGQVLRTVYARTPGYEPRPEVPVGDFSSFTTSSWSVCGFGGGPMACVGLEDFLRWNLPELEFQAVAETHRDVCGVTLQGDVVCNGQFGFDRPAPESLTR